MSLIDVKMKMQKNVIGRIGIKIYHYLYAVPMATFAQLRYDLASKQKKYNTLKNIKFFKDSETFEMLSEDKMSLCRFGDGEMTWICGNAKGYFGQKNSKKLSERLSEIIESNHENILLGIPKFFDDMDEYSERRKKNRNVHLSKYANCWIKYCGDKNKKYADALITRVFLGRNTNHEWMFKSWKTVWDKRDIVIVEGELTFFGVGNDLLNNSKSIKRVICPAENAFAFYESILDEILKLDKDALYLLALGPTATILAYDLARQGFQAIDVGHLDIEYEWYKMANQNNGEKKSVKGKYVNEVGGAPRDSLDRKLLDEHSNQIICKCV